MKRRLGLVARRRARDAHDREVLDRLRFFVVGPTRRQERQGEPADQERVDRTCAHAVSLQIRARGTVLSTRLRFFEAITRGRRLRGRSRRRCNRCWRSRRGCRRALHRAPEAAAEGAGATGAARSWGGRHGRRGATASAEGTAGAWSAAGAAERRCSRLPEPLRRRDKSARRAASR